MWIHITECLPREDELCVVFYEDMSIDIETSETIYQNIEFGSGTKITHWFYLPPDPVEIDDNQIHMSLN